jgi:hypothetical protein
MKNHQIIISLVVLLVLFGTVSFIYKQTIKINEIRNSQEKENLLNIFQKLSERIEQQETALEKRNKVLISQTKESVEQMVRELVEKEIESMVQTVKFSIKKEFGKFRTNSVKEETKSGNNSKNEGNTVTLKGSSKTVKLNLPNETDESSLKKDFEQEQALSQLVNLQVLSENGEAPLFVEIGGNGMFSIIAAMSGARSVSLLPPEELEPVRNNAALNGVEAKVNAIRKQNFEQIFSEDILVLAINEVDSGFDTLKEAESLISKYCIKNIWLRGDGPEEEWEWLNSKGYELRLNPKAEKLEEKEFNQLKKKIPWFVATRKDCTYKKEPEKWKMDNHFGNN